MKTYWLLLLCRLAMAGEWATNKVLRECSVLAGKDDRRSAQEDARYEKLKRGLKNLESIGPTQVEKEAFEKMRAEVAELEERLFGRDAPAPCEECGGSGWVDVAGGRPYAIRPPQVRCPECNKETTS